VTENSDSELERSDSEPQRFGLKSEHSGSESEIWDFEAEGRVSYSGVQWNASRRRERGHPARHERDSAKAVRLYISTSGDKARRLSVLLARFGGQDARAPGSRMWMNTAVGRTIRHNSS
jgi:hypothetical protein